MVGTGVLDATDHGPASFHSINTGGHIICEALSANRRAAAGSSETFIALALPQDWRRDLRFTVQVSLSLSLSLSRKTEVIRSIDIN
jgi:hypothetical protein